jgi:hypothetical protein
MSVRIKDNNNIPSLLSDLEKLRDIELQVGIPKDAGKEIIIRANVNEYGSAGKSEIIPERSFIRATFDEERRKLDEMGDKGVMNVLAGRESPDDVLERMGKYLVEAVKEKIRNMEPENDPDTIEQKGSSQPLIDTGDMIDSITYKVVR